jgi:hypothetical protein
LESGFPESEFRETNMALILNDKIKKEKDKKNPS